MFRCEHLKMKLLTLLALYFACLASKATPQDWNEGSLNGELSINQIQVIGTHNSYHLAPEPKLLTVIAAASDAAAKAIDYSHAPLETQLGEYGIRQLELDIYADPRGGLYANPIGRSLIGTMATDNRMYYDFQSIMSKPGMKIIHSPGFDYATTVPTLVDALKQIRTWSLSHPGHVPILVMIEIKEDVTGPAGVKPISFDAQLLEAVDAEIKSVVSLDGMLTPDMVRGDFKTLREAVLEKGWPKLNDCRGKLMFAMDNESQVRDLYLEGHPVLENRIMFTSVEETHPAAAWMKINDPIRDFDSIQAKVSKGYLVRTRADSETRHSRENDNAQRDRAFASGAQFISTDYPRPDHRFSDYCVRFEAQAVVRNNPISAPNR